MKNIWTILFAVLLTSQVFSQDKYLTKQGYVSFFSHALIEDIRADNNQVLSIIDVKSGEIVIHLLMKSFLFKKALMQEHFNENYVESNKYPKAKFRGVILNYNLLENINGKAEIKGILSVHGIEKEILTMATVDFIDEKIILKGEFLVNVSDFDIKIPSVVKNKIAKTIKVSYELHHKPYK